MLTGISNSSLYTPPSQEVSSVSNSSADTKENNVDGTSLTGGYVATVSSQPSDAITKAQGAINASLIDQAGGQKPAGGPPPGGPPPGGPPPGGPPSGGGTEATSESLLVDLFSDEEDDEDDISDVLSSDSLNANESTLENLLESLL